MINFLIGFITGYIWFPTYKAIKILWVMRKIDRTMKEIYREHDEIREMFKEVDKEWNDKNE